MFPLFCRFAKRDTKKDIISLLHYRDCVPVLESLIGAIDVLVFCALLQTVKGREWFEEVYGKLILRQQGRESKLYLLRAF